MYACFSVLGEDLRERVNTELRRVWYQVSKKKRNSFLPEPQNKRKLDYSYYDSALSVHLLRQMIEIGTRDYHGGSNITVKAIQEVASQQFTASFQSLLPLTCGIQ